MKYSTTLSDAILIMICTFGVGLTCFFCGIQFNHKDTKMKLNQCLERQESKAVRS